MLEDQEKINLLTGYSQSEHCAGTLYYTACTLVSAVGEYNITIENGLTTIDNPGDPRIIAISNNAHVNHSADPRVAPIPSTLGGILDIHKQRWQSTISTYIVDGVFTQTSLTTSAYAPYQQDPAAQCESYSDPHEDMLTTLNRAMIYAGALAGAKDREYLETRLDDGLIDLVNTTTIGYVSGKHQVFHTDYWWFLGAAIVEIVCVAFILPTYWGTYSSHATTTSPPS
jgi:hypothetical protein